MQDAAVGAAVAASSSADLLTHGRWHVHDPTVHGNRSMCERGAVMAVDGKDSSYWASKLDAEGPQSFMIDFGSARKLQKFVFSLFFSYFYFSSRAHLWK